jgi:galactokinase/mevalonate kinase-like predicted kinase
VLDNTNLTKENAKALADATESCWNAILARDIQKFGLYVRRSFEAQIAMFPNMLNETIQQLIDHYRDIALGWKLSGAGGGGYLILVSETPIDNGVRIIIRRVSD